MWKAKLPEDVNLQGTVRLCIEADLKPDGTFGREWLVVADSRVIVLAEDGAQTRTRLEFPLNELKEPKVQNLVGGASLRATHGDKDLELVRFSSARAPRFGTAAHLIEKWSKGEEAEPPEEEERHCRKCGLPLEQGTRVCPVCHPKRRTLLRLIVYLKPNWKQAVLLSFLAMLGTLAGMVPPYLNKPLIDNVLAPPQDAMTSAEDRLRLLGFLILTLVAAHVLMAVFSAAQGWLSAWLGNRITHHIRCDLYQRLQYLSLRFFDKRQMGTVISRVNQDTGQLQRFLVWGAQDLLINLLLVVGIGIFLFVLNWKLALFVLIPAPIVAFVSRKFWRRIHYYMHRFFHRWGRLNSFLSESLSGLRIVKAFAQEPRQVEQFEERSEELAITGTHAERVWSILFSSVGLFITMGSVLVWYVGGRGIIFGEMQLGTLVAFMHFVAMFYRPVQFLSMLLNWCSRSLTAAERVFEVMDARPEVQEAEDAVPMPHIDGHVEFKDVRFGYERHQLVLKDISCSIEPGEMIGLVGHSGAGKTTTINLLCRFYDVLEGDILIDGVPIRQIQLENLRHQIGLVPQDTFLFSGTIAENISYAKPGATREEIIRAAKVANAHEFIIKKPDGYESLIGEQGGGISAGEKQRLAIARAVLHNPRILILDEATSQVDVETEKRIQEAIDRLVRGRTTFAIAHRLSTLKNAGRLIVLRDGKIAEMGTHDELLNKEDGEFRRLVDTYQEISRVHVVQR